jgi:chromosome partitioning protein
MKTIPITAQKGGAGKSTLTAHLAVEFHRLEKHVAVLDLDRQGSLSFWRNQRQAEDPQVLNINFGEFETYRKNIEQEGFDYLLVDTPPHAGAGIQSVVNKSDLVLVPLRPGPLDVAALGATVDFLDASRTLFVLNQVPSVCSEADEARELLKQSYAGFQVARNHLGLRKAYSHALISGLSIIEFERPGTKAYQEITELFTEIMEKLK